MTSVLSIKQDQEAVNEGKLSFVKAQKASWQRIPYLALQADGVSGYSDHLSTCYHYGYWIIRSSESQGIYYVAVDCATGDLVYTNSRHEKLTPDDDILAKLKPEELSAGSIISDLKSQAKEKPFFNARTSEQREQIAVDSNIQPKYKRN